MLRFHERTPRPNSHRRGDADAKRLKNPPAMSGGFIAIAKQQGKYTGRKAVVHPDFDKVIVKWRDREISAVQAMRKLGMSKSAFYRHVKRLASVG